MSDLNFEKVLERALPMSTLQNLTKRAMVENCNSEKSKQKARDFVDIMSSSNIEQVLKDLKRMPKLVLINEETGERKEYTAENFKNVQDAINFLKEISKDNEKMVEYLTKYFHQGGFQNASEMLLTTYFTQGQAEGNELILTTGADSRCGTFTLKSDGTIAYEETFDIVKVKSGPGFKNEDFFSDNTKAMSSISCQSVLSLGDDEKIKQEFGEVKIKASHPKMIEAFNSITFKAASALNSLKVSQKKADQEYYKELTETYGLTPEKIETYAMAFYQKINKDKRYKDFDAYLNQHFSEPVGTKPLDNYIGYLIGQQRYAVSTIDAGSGMPIVSQLIGIYRHGYIQIYDSPFKNGEQHYNKNNEILELSPLSQTNEITAARVTGQVRVVPGIVTMALHIAGKERLESGEYNMKHYRPWVNDCQTYYKHAQEKMNTILAEIDKDSGKALQQGVIDHYRYRPEMTKKDASWLRRQAGLLLQPDKKIFHVDEKGIRVRAGAEKIHKNARNVKIDRDVSAYPSKDRTKYFSWAIKQFSWSLYDRAKQFVRYKKAKYSTKGNIHDAIKQLSKQDRFIHEMTDTLLADGIKLLKNKNLKDEDIKNKDLPYKEILGKLRIDLIKDSAELSLSLEKLHADPFNAELSKKVEISQKKVLKGCTNLGAELENLSTKMQDMKIDAPREIKNIKDGIKDLKKYENSLSLKINVIFKVSASKKESEKQVQFDPMLPGPVVFLPSAKPKEKSKLKDEPHPSKGPRSKQVFKKD